MWLAGGTRLEEAGPDGGDLSTAENLRGQQVKEDAGVDGGNIGERVRI